MADLNELIAYLLMGQPQQQAIAESDPYLGFQKNVADPLSNAVLGAAQDKQYGTGEKVGAGLLTGLMSGLFGGLSQNYQKRAGDAYKSALFGSAMGQGVEKPSVLSPNLFQAAQEQGEAFRLRNALMEKQSAQAQEQEAQKEVFKKMLDNPRQYERNLPRLRQLLGGSAPAEPIAAVPGASAPIAAPGSAERLDFFLDQTMGDESAAEALFLDEVKANREGIQRTEDKKQKLESDTYSRITGLKSYTPFVDIDTNFKTLASLVDNDEAVTSPAMITSFNRILDPASTTREGEYKTINANVQSLLDKIQGDWRQAMLGKTSLSKKAREEMVKIASEKYNQFGAKYGMERKGLLDALTSQGGDVANVPTSGFTPWMPQGLTPQQFIDSAKAQGMDKQTAKFLFDAMFGGK